MAKQQHVLFEEPNDFTQQSPLSSPEIHTPPTLSNRLDQAYEKGVQAGIQKKAEEVRQHAEAREEGVTEHIKEERKEVAKMNAIIKNISQKDDVILFKAKTVFPFDFFPDTIIIDTIKISIITKTFFASQQVVTVSIKDLVDVELETAFFLSNVVISYLPKVDTPTGMIKPHEHRVDLLKNTDAMRIKNILKGIQLAQREGIDVAKIKPEELTEFIEKVGTIKTDY